MLQLTLRLRLLKQLRLIICVHISERTSSRKGGVLLRVAMRARFAFRAFRFSFARRQTAAFARRRAGEFAEGRRLLLRVTYGRVAARVCDLVSPWQVFTFRFDHSKRASSSSFTVIFILDCPLRGRHILGRPLRGRHIKSPT